MWCIIVFCFVGVIRMLHNLLWSKSTEWFGSALSRTMSLLLSARDVCRLPSTWHTLHVDRLHDLLWRLCNYSWRVWWLLGRRWGSWATFAPHHGGDCARSFHSYRHILQRPGSNNGWPADLAAALPHSRQTNANQGICCRGCRWRAHRLVSAATPCRAHQPAEVAGASIIAHTIMSMADDVDLKLGLGSALPSCTGGNTKQEVKASLVSAWKCVEILFSLFFCIL